MTIGIPLSGLTRRNMLSAEEIKMKLIEDRYCTFCEMLTKVKGTLGGSLFCPHEHIRVDKDGEETSVYPTSRGLYGVHSRKVYKNHLGKIVKRF